MDAQVPPASKRPMKSSSGLKLRMSKLAGTLEVFWSHPLILQLRKLRLRRSWDWLISPGTPVLKFCLPLTVQWQPTLCAVTMNGTWIISGEEWAYFFFSGLHLQHMEVPRLGAELEPQLQACTTTTAMWDPSCLCDLYHSSWQCQILDPLRGQGSNLHPRGS